MASNEHVPIMKIGIRRDDVGLALEALFLKKRQPVFIEPVFEPLVQEGEVVDLPALEKPKPRAISARKRQGTHKAFALDYVVKHGPVKSGPIAKAAEEAGFMRSSTYARLDSLRKEGLIINNKDTQEWSAANGAASARVEKPKHQQPAPGSQSGKILAKLREVYPERMKSHQIQKLLRIKHTSAHLTNLVTRGFASKERVVGHPSGKAYSFQYIPNTE